MEGRDFAWGRERLDHLKTQVASKLCVFLWLENRGLVS